MAVHSFRIPQFLVALCGYFFVISRAVVVPHKSGSSSPGAFTSYNYGQHRALVQERQTGGQFAVTEALGGTGPNGSAPLRLEIRDIQQDHDLFTLYILGLDFMQFTSQDDPMSWYQIAGIHGRPFVPWDGVQPTDGNGNNGYCTHVSILFPTWHRPYLALFEQILYSRIQFIASLYPAGPVQDQYVAAAANFRIPYWDWAAVPPSGESVLPDIIGGSPGISVDGPFGTQIIANPLFCYIFQPLNTTELPDFPLNQWSQTMRFPSTLDPSSVSQNSFVAQQLDNSAPSFRSRLYNLFTNYNDYTTFSNEAWIPQDNSQGYDSIESIHDQIHGLTGSGGHMMYIDYAAFDPIFFLHHAMIDRCFAMWQKLNPNSYVIPEPSTYGTFTTSPGQTEDAYSPLTPFLRDDVGNFWNSIDGQDTETFSYAYAETAKYAGNSASNISETVTEAINRLYGDTSPASASNRIRSGPIRRQSAKSGKGRHLKDGQHREWIANIRVSKQALSGPFFIHIFLGSFGIDPSRWSFEPNLVGTHTIFSRATGRGSGFLGSRNIDAQVTATMPLTASLLQKFERGELRSLHPEDVEEYLRKKLRYRVSLTEDIAVENEKVPSLKIIVVSSVVESATCNTKFPTWEPFRVHFEVDGTM